MKIVFLLWCIGLYDAPTEVAAYPTERACLRQMLESNALVLELSKVAPGANLKPVAYVCMAAAR